MDISPAMIEQARAKVPQATFDVADAQALPYEDDSFDVVSSVFGAMFAPDAEAAARELARVCRDRLGLTAWEPSPELAELYQQFELEAPEGRGPFEWGKRDVVQRLLGSAFSLEIERRSWLLEGADGEELWQLWSTSAPPFKAMIGALDAERLDAFHEAYVAYCERYRVGERVRVPRTYLLVVGRKK